MLPEITAVRRKQAISMTPLIDVVFILLLFFMLSSTFNRTQQITIQAAAPGQSQPQETKVIQMRLHLSGEITLDGQRYAAATTETATAPAVLAALQNLAQHNTPVQLAAESEVPVQSLIALVDQVTAAGISNLKLSESVAP